MKTDGKDKLPKLKVAILELDTPALYAVVNWARQEIEKRKVGEAFDSMALDDLEEIQRRVRRALSRREKRR